MRAVRVIAWVAMVALCALAFVRTGHVALACAALALVVIALGGWACAFAAARKQDVALDCASTASKGSPVPVAITVTNGSRLPVAHMALSVGVRNLLTGEVAERSASASVAPRSSAVVNLDLASEFCGRLECAVVSVRLFDPLRLFASRAACTATRRLTVMPELHEASLRDRYAVAPLSDTTVFSPTVRGSDLSEVFGLREYEPGDELKRIHWKLSEKVDQVIVRDASLPLDNALLLFWDKRAPEGASAGAQGASAGCARAADAMAEVMLAIMESLAHAGVDFEVASNDLSASRCMRAFASGEDDVYELISQLLSAPVAFAAESGLAEYLRFYGELSCSRLIYVCCCPPAELETLPGMRDALVIVCDPSGGELSYEVRPPVTELRFPADGARSVLDMLEVL